MTPEDTTITRLRADLRVAGQAFADRISDLVPAAQALVAAETALRIAENQAGTRVTGGPPARELAVDVLHGRLGCLRPYLQFMTSEAADRATEALCAAPAKPKKQARP